MAIEKDHKVLLIGSDLESLICSIIISFLMKKHDMNYSNATNLVRERFIALKPIQIVHKYL